MSKGEQISIKIAKACKEITKQLNGRLNPDQDEIITALCNKHKVEEKHIRVLLEFDKGRRSTRYNKTVK